MPDVNKNSNKVDLALKALIVVLTVAIVFVVSQSLEQKVVDKGDRAPKFAVVTDQGPTISKSDFKGKLLVLNFWATWCPPCLQEWPSLNAFAEKYKDKGVVVLAVSIDRNDKRYRDFLAKNPPKFLTSRDPDSNLPASYGTFLMPESYIIDQQGKIVYKVANAQDWSDPAFINFFNSLL